MTVQLRRLRATSTVLVAMTAMMAMMVTSAVADAVYPPDQDFGVVCTPSNPQPGDDVSCEVVGAQPGEALDATATAEVQGVIYEDSLTADDDGVATFAFSTDGIDEGEQVDVVVRGAQSGETGFTVTAESTDEVDDDGDPITATITDDTAADRLPVTGGQVTLLSLVGLALVGGGLLALRKRASVA